MVSDVILSHVSLVHCALLGIFEMHVTWEMKLEGEINTLSVTGW